MRKIHLYLVLVLSISLHTIAQQTPTKKQTKSVLILNATAHLGNGQIIENSAIGFKDGKLTYNRSMILTRSFITADKYATVRDFFAKILAAEQSPVVLMRQ